MMLRRLQAFLVLPLWVLPFWVLAFWASSSPARAQASEEPAADASPSEPPSDAEPAAPAPSDGGEPGASDAAGEPESDDGDAASSSSSTDANGAISAELGASAGEGDARSSADTKEPHPEAPAEFSAELSADSGAGASADEHTQRAALDEWDTFVTGYFRVPMAIGLSPRPGPDAPDGDASQQLSYGPNRTLDSNYYSFAYTRLQEQDWAEIFIHAKKEHVEAVVGWMGYWYQSAGFRNYDAGWVPGMAYLVLDTEFEAAGAKPKVALTTGAWWPKFGSHVKYDTYTLGQFRHVGEQVKLTLPLGDFTATLVQGFGTSRDGSFNILAPPPYQAKVGLNLIHYENLSLAYRDYVDVGLHYNTQWTRDPNLFPTTQPGKAYSDAVKGDLSTIGGELKVKVPKAGNLWLSPSYVQVTNGWALADAGIELMHSLSADGLATNYLAWSGSLSDSTGSGSLLNLGFLYENSLANLMGKPRGSLPDLTFNAFGLFTDITLDLPEGSIITQHRIGQFKYGADLEYQALEWLALMLRWDEVNYNLSHAGYLFSAITGRVTLSSHFMSGERVYLQYSRYRYGDAMELAGQWPWGTPLIAGADIIQGGPYAGDTPDMDVIKLQAEVTF